MSERYLRSSSDATADDSSPMTFGGEKVPPKTTIKGQPEIVQIAPAIQETLDSSKWSGNQQVAKV